MQHQNGKFPNPKMCRERAKKQEKRFLVEKGDFKIEINAFDLVYLCACELVQTAFLESIERTTKK